MSDNTTDHYAFRTPTAVAPRRDWRGSRRVFSLLATVASTLAMGLFAVAVPQAHAEVTPCRNDQVTVMVEGQGTGCASGGVTGWDALEQAGFTITPVSRFPGMICQIGGAPNTDCTNPPSSNAYWTYWHAPLGGSWSYSSAGAQNRIAPAGTVEAWTFGSGTQPGPVPEARADSPQGNSGGTSAEDLGYPPVDGDESSLEGGRASGSGASGRGNSQPGGRGDQRDPAGGAGRDDDSKSPGQTTDSAKPSQTSESTAKTTSTETTSSEASATDTSGAGHSGNGGASGGKPGETNAAQTANDSGSSQWTWLLVLLVVVGMVAAGVVISKRRGVQEQ